MRIFLIVMGVLVLLTVLLCISHPVVVLSYRGRKFEWCVKYLGIKILPLGIKILPRKKKDGGKPRKKKRDAENDEQRRDFLMDKLWKLMMNIAGKADMAGSALYALPRPLAMLFRGVTWYNIEMDFVIGGDDAAETAQLYGKIQMILHPLLGGAAQIMKVRCKKISIVCDYTEDVSRWDCGCCFKISVGTVLAVLIWLAWDYLKDSINAGRALVSSKL